MYNKLNLSIGKVASTTSIKPEMKAIAFYGDRTVATDSYRLIEVTAQGEKLEKPVLYNADLIKKVVKLKKDETIKLEDLLIEPLSDDLTYPVVDEVLRNAEDGEYTEIKVNAEYLAEVLNVLKEFNAFKSVTLKVPTAPQKPIFITTENKDQKARAILMPLN